MPVAEAIDSSIRHTSINNPLPHFNRIFVNWSIPVIIQELLEWFRFNEDENAQ